MHLKNFKYQEQTMKEFTNMCERLEYAISNSPSREQTNKGLSNKNESRGNKKIRRNNSNNKNGEKKFYCLFHGKNSTHDTNDCWTLKQQAEEHKRSRSGNRENKCNNKKKATIQTRKRSTRLCNSQRNAMNKDTNKELKNFENLLVSDKESKWKAGSGMAKSLIIMR